MFIGLKGNKHVSLARKTEDKLFGQVVWSYLPESVHFNSISTIQCTYPDSIPVIKLNTKRGLYF